MKKIKLLIVSLFIIFSGVFYINPAFSGSITVKIDDNIMDMK